MENPTRDAGFLHRDCYASDYRRICNRAAVDEMACQLGEINGFVAVGVRSHRGRRADGAGGKLPMAVLGS
jgi:hypothetical protein